MKKRREEMVLVFLTARRPWSGPVEGQGSLRPGALARALRCPASRLAMPSGDVAVVSNM